MPKTGDYGGQSIITLHGDGEKRHKTHCTYFNDGFCGYQLQKCTGSAHCDYYEEREKLINQKPSQPQPTVGKIDPAKKDGLPGRPIGAFEIPVGKKVLLIWHSPKRKCIGTVLGGNNNTLRILLKKYGSKDYERNSPYYSIRIIAPEDSISNDKNNTTGKEEKMNLQITEDEKKAWNIIVERYNQFHSALESKIESEWDLFLYRFLGYDPLYDEIEHQRTITIGANKRVIPDIIVKNDKKVLFDLELKRYDAPLQSIMEEQLRSYLDLLHLSIGVLICDKIYVYIYENKEILKRMEIAFKKDNPLGYAFIHLFKKENFSQEKVFEYINEKTSLTEEFEKLKKELTSEYAIEILKDFFLNYYSKQAIEAVFEETKITISFGNPPPPPLSGEKIQDWIKRIFGYLFKNRILTSQQIELLHDEAYSKRTFGIGYALLVDTQGKTMYSGHARYWQEPIGNYYICSQWWREKDQIYEKNIKNWISKTLPDYIARGLDRRV